MSIKTAGRDHKLIPKGSDSEGITPASPDSEGITSDNVFSLQIMRLPTNDYAAFMYKKLLS